MSKKSGNGEGTFDTLPSGAVRLRVYVDGKRCTFTGKNPTDCRKQYQNYLKDPHRKPPQSGFTLRQWLDKYLVGYRKGSMLETSYRQLELLRDHIDSDLLDTRIPKIKPIDLQGFLNRFSEHASASYIAKMTSLLRSAFAEALENDVLEKNPAKKIHTPYKPEKARESYTMEEASQIIEFAEQYRKHTKSDRINRGAVLIATAVQTLIVTGIRRGELLGLTYNDVDANEGVLHIRRGVYMDAGLPCVQDGKAKTYNSIGDVPAPNWLIERLLAVPKRGIYVFSAYSGRLMNPRNFNRAFDIFFVNLRKEYPSVRKLSPHCLRHTCATLMQKTGQNIRYVQLVLRHTNIKTTERYSHPDMAELKEATTEYADELLHKESSVGHERVTP